MHHYVETGVCEIFCLFSDRINNLICARADVQTAQPASEINVSVPVNIFD